MATLAIVERPVRHSLTWNPRKTYSRTFVWYAECGTPIAVMFLPGKTGDNSVRKIGNGALILSDVTVRTNGVEP